MSATTREPREGEVNGRDYHFLSREDFDRRVAARANSSSTPSTRETATGRCAASSPGRPAGIVLEIDVQGARQVRETLPEATASSSSRPHWKTWRAGLARRGADSPDQIERRLAAAREELAAREEFDHRIVNDHLERAARELTDLVATMCPP